jgi:hypothetical protein
LEKFGRDKEVRQTRAEWKYLDGTLYTLCYKSQFLVWNIQMASLSGFIAACGHRSFFFLPVALRKCEAQPSIGHYEQVFRHAV